MELGTGLFLSAVFLGTVALFIATKDRWNWKKIFLWPLGVVLALSVIGGTVGYVYKQYDERPRKLTTLWDIPLGAIPTDVKFVKGEPTSKLDEDTWVYSLDDDKKSADYIIRFHEGKVNFVIYAGAMYRGPTIQGVSSYGTPQDLEKKLGKPSYISNNEDGTKRNYSFEKFNVVVQFEANKVTALGIKDFSTGALKFKKELGLTEQKNK